MEGAGMQIILSNVKRKVVINMGKYCPLSWLSPKKFTNEECETKECAWWDNKREQCSIKTFLTDGEVPSGTESIDPWLASL
jgi:hypothetical protein